MTCNKDVYFFTVNVGGSVLFLDNAKKKKRDVGRMEWDRRIAANLK